MPRTRSLVTSAVGAALLVPSVAFAQLLGPSPAPGTPYLRFTDSPFAPLGPWEYFEFENFEDGLLNVPGVTASGGGVLSPGSTTDSVDEDDGVVNGIGTAGRSWFAGSGPTGVTWTFDLIVLGALPTHAGIVWTDGVNNVGFEAFDAFGASLGTRSGSHATAGFGGQTGEDRFYGVAHPGGISRIVMRSGGGFGIELDHLQYGRLAPSVIPEPSAVALLCGGLLGLAVATRRRRR